MFVILFTVQPNRLVCDVTKYHCNMENIAVFLAKCVLLQGTAEIQSLSHKETYGRYGSPAFRRNEGYKPITNNHQRTQALIRSLISKVIVQLLS